MRLRQVVLAARDLAPVEEALCGVLGVEVCYRDPNVDVFGLKNAIMPIGDAFLEVVCPVRSDASAARYIERKGGDCGYMVIIQCDDLEIDRKRVAEQGIRVVWSIDLPEISTTHLHPRDVGGAILSLDAARPPESWLWAGPKWESAVRTSVTRSLVGITIQAARPEGLADKWSRVLDRPVERSPNGLLRMSFDQGFIDFEKETDGRGEGLSGIALDVADRKRFIAEAGVRGLPTTGNEVVICGTRIRCV